MKCSKYNYCSAPLCKEDMINHARWFPGEEICHKLGPATRQQRKIAKKTKSQDTYYTIEMLQHDCRISKGIKGIDPDKPEVLQIIKWFQNHKAITKEERESWQERLQGRGFKAI